MRFKSYNSVNGNIMTEEKTEVKSDSSDHRRSFHEVTSASSSGTKGQTGRLQPLAGASSISGQYNGYLLSAGGGPGFTD